jgi:DDE superfamily endonuclease
MIGMASSTQRILPKNALKSGQIQGARQDGNREFISLLACISATGSVLPPALIYRGESGTLQDTWVEDWNPQDEVYLAVTANGWSSDALGLRWLEDVFQRHTGKGQARGRRLLIVDGHSSHVNLQFIEKCDQLRILLLILPPHATHRLQLLDVSLFAPLATFYTNGLQEVMFSSLGSISITKRMFWSIFWPAWQQAFTPTNIASGFTKTGIWPFNPAIVLDKIAKSNAIPPPEASQQPATPLTARRIRQFQRSFRNAPNSPTVAKLLRANEVLAAQHSVDQHVVKGLQQALNNEKRRRNRGKRLNLIGEEASGAQFFSPKRVEAALAWQAQKEEAEIQRQREIASKRIQAAAKKQYQEEAKVERAAIALQKRQLATEERVQKAAEKQALRELKEVAKTPLKRPIQLQGDSTRPQKVQKRAIKQNKSAIKVIDLTKEEEVVLETTRGRRILRPRRFIL